MLLAGLSAHGLLSSLSDITPGPPTVDWLLLHQLSVKEMRPTFLSTSQSNGSIFSTQVPSPQTTLGCAMLAERLANAGTLCSLLII